MKLPATYGERYSGSLRGWPFVLLELLLLAGVGALLSSFTAFTPSRIRVPWLALGIVLFVLDLPGHLGQFESLRSRARPCDNYFVCSYKKCTYHIGSPFGDKVARRPANGSGRGVYEYDAEPRDRK